MKKSIQSTNYAHQRGGVQESAIKALVTDKLFRMRVERNHKGKGSYRRKAKHHKGYKQGQDPFKNILKEYF